jgi:hypothetical protein
MEALTILIVDLLPDGDVRERDVTAPGSPEYAHVSSLSVLGGNTYIHNTVRLQCWNFRTIYAGTRNRVRIGLSYRPARLHRLEELIP